MSNNKNKFGKWFLKGEKWIYIEFRTDEPINKILEDAEILIDGIKLEILKPDDLIDCGYIDAYSKPILDLRPYYGDSPITDDKIQFSK